MGKEMLIERGGRLLEVIQIRMVGVRSRTSRVERGSFYDLPSPQQTGHADFPHPAFHENYH